jgi:hypothetical protein
VEDGGEYASDYCFLVLSFCFLFIQGLVVAEPWRTEESAFGMHHVLLEEVPVMEGMLMMQEQQDLRCVYVCVCMCVCMYVCVLWECVWLVSCAVRRG